jgi:PTS system N-acetylglucosamine-specific IIC component
MRFKFDKIQQLGRALMLPISLLPVAGILLRFGQPDLLNLKYIAEAGAVIFDQLPLLFALGVAIGLAKDNNGTAGLAAAVGFLVMNTITSSINKDINTGVLGGMLIGILTAILYNKYKDIKLPDYFAFFGGKRFIPIITGLSSVVVGVILGHIWPPIQSVINDLGHELLKSGAVGLFFYGVLNRLLLITGLHHILNNLVWTVFGSFTTSSGAIVHGDISMFMSGDKSAGFFMSGFFPIMMFGLPAACLAMYKNALPENKKAVAGMLISMAMTSFLTGVTEPIEFSFIFLAPFLYVIHALLTGISMVIMYLFNVHLGFTFSAGLIDYILFFKIDQHPLLLIPIGIIFFAIYYLLFNFIIQKFDLKTIGRDISNNQISVIKVDSRALQFIEALGGSNNLVSVDACTTRLRLVVQDSNNINKHLLQSLGAKGVIAPSLESLQVILGPVADIVASEIREALAANNDVRGVATKTVKHDEPITNNETLSQNIINQAKEVLNALGGKANLESINVVALTRLRITVYDESKIDFAKLIDLGIVKIFNFDNKNKQLYVGNNAEKLYIAMMNY